MNSQSAHEPGAVEETFEHEHGPRHGGYFGDAEDLYHYELLLESPNRLLLYVNDEWNRPLDVRTLTGRYILNPDSPSPSTGAFIPSADGEYFHAALPSSATESLHVEVQVFKADQWVGLEFHLPAASSAAPAQ